MARPSRRILYENDPTFLWKLVLRSLAILLDIIGMILLAWAIAKNIVPSLTLQAGFPLSNAYYTSADYALLPGTFASFGLSLIWCAVYIGILLSRNKAVHPGWSVAFDLLLWMGFITTSFFQTVGAIDYINNYVGYDDSAEDAYAYVANGTEYIAPKTTPCALYTSCDAEHEYAAALRHKGIVIAVSAALGFIVLLFHFALFISACRYTRCMRHPASKHFPKVVEKPIELGSQSKLVPSALSP